MKAYFLIDFIVFLNIYCVVWAQTLNNEPTTQLPGNTEPLALEMTQTPKLGDNQTEYENTTTIQTNDIDSNISIDLVSMNNTFNVTKINEKTIEVTESNTHAMDSETITTTNNPTDQENQTLVIDSGNSSSKSIEGNEGKEQQTSDLMTNLTSILITNEANDRTVTPQSLTTNVTSIFNDSVKSSKALNLSDNSSDETNDSLNSISDTIYETLDKTSNITEESYFPSTESSAINSDNKSTTPQNSTLNSQHMYSSLPEITETTQINQINSRQTIETSTHKPSDTTQGIQTTTINAYSESNSSPKTEESAQITEIPIKSSESQTVTNHYYISNASEPIDQNIQNQTQYTEIPPIHNLNATETSSTAPTESILYSKALEVQTLPKLSTISTSLEAQKQTNPMETMQTNEQKQSESTQTIPQTENEKSIITTTISASTDSVRQFSESQRESKSQSEPMQTETKPLAELQRTSSSTISPTVTQPKQTTQFQSQSIMSSTEAKVSEKVTASPTQQSQSPDVQTESQMTESNITVLGANDSQPSIDSQTTFKLPLTDHSLKTTQYLKPMTTSIPLESNISAITVTLPNIKYISSISKEDMFNIVNITFYAESIDIFRWVSIYDQTFRNFTCNRIDTERSWCTIDRFIYLSPSPLVVNNHLILNFLIDDSTDNDLNNFHVFAGPLIVEALKNSTDSLETKIGMKVMSLQTNMGTMVIRPLLDSFGPNERLVKFELLFIFTVVMFICTALLCLAVICSYAKRKSVDMNQIQLSNAGRRHTAINGGFDLNSASNILRDENQENKFNHNVINLDGWVAPIDQVDSEKITKYDNLQDTKL